MADIEPFYQDYASTQKDPKPKNALVVGRFWPYRGVTITNHALIPRDETFRPRVFSDTPTSNTLSARLISSGPNRPI
jgi:hypothetical protein